MLRVAKFSAKVRVVFSTSVFEDTSTGPATYAHALWDALSVDPDMEFHLVAPRVPSGHPRAHESGFATTSSSTSDSLRLYRALASKTLEVARRDPRTIIHSNASHSAYSLIGHAGPVITQINDYETLDVWGNAASTLRRSGIRRFCSLLWRNAQEARVVRSATRVICNSIYTRERVVDGYRINSSKTTVVYPAVNLSAFRRPSRPPSDPYAYRPPGARIVFIGSDWRRKGLLTLMQAVQNVAAYIPNVHLLVAGPSDLDSLRTLSATVDALGIRSNVTLAGRVGRETLPSLLFHSDLFVLPTRGEAFGISILEAMAAGLPVIASAVGGIPEIIQTPDEGMIIPPNDVSSLTTAILRVLSDSSLRSRLSAAGRGRASTFRVESMAAHVKAIYLALRSDHANIPIN